VAVSNTDSPWQVVMVDATFGHAVEQVYAGAMHGFRGFDAARGAEQDSSGYECGQKSA
jgi:hypothetical protein